MIENKIFVPGEELITEVDLYFPGSRLAIFCDSKFHRGKKNIEKDKRIDESLTNLGIRSVRVSGKEIMGNLMHCVEQIISML